MARCGRWARGPQPPSALAVRIALRFEPALTVGVVTEARQGIVTHRRFIGRDRRPSSRPIPPPPPRRPGLPRCWDGRLRTSAGADPLGSIPPGKHSPAVCAHRSPPASQAASTRRDSLAPQRDGDLFQECQPHGYVRGSADERPMNTPPDTWVARLKSSHAATRLDRLSGRSSRGCSRRRQLPHRRHGGSVRHLSDLPLVGECRRRPIQGLDLQGRAGDGAGPATGPSAQRSRRRLVDRAALGRSHS